MENKFTGWYDVPLSAKGHEEAAEGGELLNDHGFKFDVAYTSYLKRAIRTCSHVLEATDCLWIPIEHAWELNERHYGGLTGLDKQATVDKYGKEKVMVWRRSFDIPPPEIEKTSEHFPGNDYKYHLVDPELLLVFAPRVLSVPCCVAPEQLSHIHRSPYFVRVSRSPTTESLKTTAERVLPYFEKVIVPQIKAGKRVLIAAHGNSLR